MRKIGICPKCNSSEIYTNSNESFNHKRILQAINPKKIFDRGIALNSYICLECGYVEDYVAQKDLEKRRELIRYRWKKIK
ncbi:MAG: hypothetical protein COZ18_13095 [Flexibacter sp. CG_4_10_14_3_um_filter_32_15]|nr:MAG: hypothetical protein COZ18_13095 [Flexibacter sp. CG_4_10_14_3_um_filter_32_15]